MVRPQVDLSNKRSSSNKTMKSGHCSLYSSKFKSNYKSLLQSQQNNERSFLPFCGNTGPTQIYRQARGPESKGRWSMGTYTTKCNLEPIQRAVGSRLTCRQVMFTAKLKSTNKMNSRTRGRNRLSRATDKYRQQQEKTSDSEAEAGWRVTTITQGGNRIF